MSVNLEYSDVDILELGDSIAMVSFLGSKLKICLTLFVEYCCALDHHKNGASIKIRSLGYRKYRKDWEMLGDDLKKHWYDEARKLMQRRERGVRNNERPMWEQLLENSVYERMLECERNGAKEKSDENVEEDENVFDFEPVKRKRGECDVETGEGNEGIAPNHEENTSFGTKRSRVEVNDDDDGDKMEEEDYSRLPDFDSIEYIGVNRGGEQLFYAVLTTGGKSEAVVHTLWDERGKCAKNNFRRMLHYFLIGVMRMLSERL
jgi:hypothetical protein